MDYRVTDSNIKGTPQLTIKDFKDFHTNIDDLGILTIEYFNGFQIIITYIHPLGITQQHDRITLILQYFAHEDYKFQVYCPLSEQIINGVDLKDDNISDETNTIIRKNLVFVVLYYTDKT